MKVEILHLAEGAAKAGGLAVVIDVFRAYSLEAYLFSWGAETIIPTAEVEKARQLKDMHPEYVLIGERHGRILPGFDFGNSPSTVDPEKIKGRTVVHTTSAGTQGIALAAGADEILAGSLLNAAATARYIKMKDPEYVSLVAMGWEGLRKTEEDELCARYLEALLRDEPYAGLEEEAHSLMHAEGKKFFDPAQQDVFPEEDFWMSIRHDVFDFAMRVRKEDGLFVCEKVPV